MTKKTTLLIRPAARGGKYLGHDAANAANQSALIAILHLESGKVVAHALAEAPTDASAGPENLMAPVSRAAPYATDDNTVKVQLDIEIDHPIDLRVLVYGPLKHPDQARVAQADITVLPGVDVGTSTQYPEGLVIEVPGLCISNAVAQLEGQQLSCTAMVTMMCGCQIHQGSADPTWPWPDTNYTIQLVTRMQSGAVYYYPMGYDATPNITSTFTGQWPTQAASGDAVEEAWIYASEPTLGNQGKYRLGAPSKPYQPRQVAQELQELVAAIHAR